MCRIQALAGVLVVAFVVFACGGNPTAPQSVLPTIASVGDDSGASSTSSAAVVKVPIAGFLDYGSEGEPGRMLASPGGICHAWAWNVYDYFGGDVEGDVTFHEKANFPCDGSGYRGSGPFEGDVTWRGRRGRITGQWTTNCKPPVGCDGTMNARGSGGLEGVQFHFKWGPGYYPFPYTGTAFAK